MTTPIENVPFARRHLEALERGATGDRLAPFLTPAVPLGTIRAGGDMGARFGVFLHFREGRIAPQRNDDCFDPF